MMKQTGKLIILSVLLMSFVGCGTGVPENLEDTLSVREINLPDDNFTINRVGVYLDVTPSMAGFLGMDTEEYELLVPETKYEICLNEVNKILAIQYDREQMAYYRVDTPMWGTEENVLKKAREKEYYHNSSNDGDVYVKVDLKSDDGEDYKSLCLTNVLLNCKEDDFSVVITDFHENTGAEAGDEVIQALKESVSSTLNEKTIGIVGIKSEFAGLVYDYDMDGRHEEYGVVEGEISAEDICYRQFYVIAIGQAETVGTFCEDVRESMRLDEDAVKSVIFYEDEICGLDYRSFAQCLTRSSETEWRFLPNGSIRINDGESINVFDYCNRKEEKREIVVCYNVEEEALKRELENGIKAVPTISELQAIDLKEVSYHMKEQAVAQWDAEKSCFEKEDNLSDSFKVEHVYYSTEEELLYIVFCLEEKELPQGPIKLSGELHMERQSTLDIGWVEDWNFSYDDRDLSKTTNLSSYIDAIIKEMPERNDLLLDFAFYLNYMK